jgi:hypothetical protein
MSAFTTVMAPQKKTQLLLAFCVKRSSSGAAFHCKWTLLHACVELLRGDSLAAGCMMHSMRVTLQQLGPAWQLMWRMKTWPSRTAWQAKT